METLPSRTLEINGEIITIYIKYQGFAGPAVRIFHLIYSELKAF